MADKHGRIEIAVTTEHDADGRPVERLLGIYDNTPARKFSDTVRFKPGESVEAFLRGLHARHCGAVMGEQDYADLLSEIIEAMGEEGQENQDGSFTYRTIFEW